MAAEKTGEHKVVTILFTDVIGSTDLKQTLGDREGCKVLQKHHSLIRQILRDFAQGEEIETAGDSFFIVFGIPSDAVRFGLLVQAKLREDGVEGHAIRDRIGIHVGEVFMEERNDLGTVKLPSGIHVDTCARVMSLALGGQILMTRFAFDNARAILKREDIEGVGPLRWLNHGPYLLKGVEEPLEICEVGEEEGLRLGAPASSEKARRHHSEEGVAVLGWRPGLDQPVPNTKWILEKKLGEGAFGEVWLGRHETLKEKRVFKFCFRADRVRSLKREVTLFRLLNEKVGRHPNIVGIQEVFFDQPPYYIVMDYAEGKDLKGWSEERGGLERVPVETKLEIVAQVAEALQAAHGAGVIHRDVKPSNILISGESRLSVKLTDFGIGQVVSQEALIGMTQMGFTQTMAIGSPQTGTQLYMAPELLAGKPASIRSDIYSLGVVLYQLLVNDLTRPLTTDWSRRIDDRWLRSDMEKCFAGEPQERFASAGELTANLRALEGRRTVDARREKTGQRQRMIRRMGVALLALAGLGILFGLAFRRPGSMNSGIGSDHARAIVVVPFHTENLNLAREYLPVSLNWELVNAIRRVPGLDAIRPPTIVATNPIAEIRFIYSSQPNANVPFLLGGAMRETNGLLKVQVILMNTADGTQVSSPEIEASATNALGIVSRVTLWIAERSGVSLDGGTRARIRREPTQDPKAYDLYLRGKFSDVSQSGFRVIKSEQTAIDYLEQAVKRDRTFALAYATLGYAYVYQYFYYEPESAPVLEAKAAEAISEAFRLDKDLPEAHYANGFFLWSPSKHWDQGAAIQEIHRALELNPNMEEAQIQLALIYLHAGLFEGGRKLSRRMQEENPPHPTAYFLEANSWFWEGNDAKAVQTWQAMPIDVRQNTIIESYIAVALINLGRTNEAANIIEKGLTTDLGGLYSSVQAVLLAKNGDPDGARAKIAQALAHVKNFGHRHHTDYNLAVAYSLLNDQDQALTYLRQAATNGFPCYPFFQADTNLTKLRQNSSASAFFIEQKKVYEEVNSKFGKK